MIILTLLLLVLAKIFWVPPHPWNFRGFNLIPGQQRDVVGMGGTAAQVTIPVQHPLMPNKLQMGQGTRVIGNERIPGAGSGMWLSLPVMCNYELRIRPTLGNNTLHRQYRNLHQSSEWHEYAFGAKATEERYQSLVSEQVLEYFYDYTPGNC